MADFITVEDWIRQRDLTARIEKAVFGNGKPGILDQAKQYIDERLEHKEANTQQDFSDIRRDIDNRHTQNTEKLDKLSMKQDDLMKLVYIGLGIVITLESVGLFKR